MLQIFDPRQGKDYEFRFSRKDVRTASELNRVVVLSGDTRCDRPPEAIGELAASLWTRFSAQALFLHLTPAPYKKAEAAKYPEAWARVFSTRRAWLFKIPHLDQEVFNEYFARTSSYEGWMFYFCQRESRIDAILPFEQFGFSSDTFTHPPVPWDVLMFYEGECGTVWWVLPFDATTDECLAELVSTGRATWAT